MCSAKRRPWRVSRCSTDRGHLDAPRAPGTSPQGEGEQESAEGTSPGAGSLEGCPHALGAGDPPSRPTSGHWSLTRRAPIALGP